MCIDLPSLRSIELGMYAFCETETAIIESTLLIPIGYFIDLPSLESITLGELSLAGNLDMTSSLTMKSNNR